MRDFQYEYVTDPSKLAQIAQEIADTPFLALDIETAAVEPWKSTVKKAAVDPRMGYIRLIQIHTGKAAYVIDVWKCSDRDSSKCNNTGRCKPIFDAIREYTGIVIGQNLKFENKWFKFHCGFFLKKCFDTWRAFNVIHNGKPDCKKSNLWILEERYLGIKHNSDPVADEDEDQQASDWSIPDLSESQLDYAAGDVRYMHLLREKMIAEIRQWGLAKVCKIEFDVVPAEAEVELNGFRMDKRMWLDLAATNKAKASILAKQLQQELPNPSNQLGLFGHMDWNLDSQQEMLQSLRKLGIKQKLKDPESRKTYTVPLQDTQEMTLAMFGDQYPVIKKILEYRGFSNRLKTFGPEYVNFIHPITGRIHASFWPFTGAGRYSCREPNLAQQPRDKAFRECYRPEKGRRLYIIDYSNVEMVIIAELSGDPTLCEIFNTGGDAHYTTASVMLNKPIDQILKAERQMAKPINFGLGFGMKPLKLVLYAKAGYGVDLTEQQAKTFSDRFFGKYTGIAAWHAKVQAEGQRTKMAHTILGRHRFMKDDDYNAFYNSPVQGSGADALKMALALVRTRLEPYGTRAQLVHHVHDEVVIEADDDDSMVDEINTLLQESMMTALNTMLTRVKGKAEASHGASWAEK